MIKHTQYLPIVFCIISNYYSSHCLAAPLPKDDNVSTYVISESFSNILPIKQLINDEWQQFPATEASTAFTQNEIGLKAEWHNFSVNVAHRLDYFVFTNADTAKAFYLERKDLPLTTQKSYQVALKLHHQRSTGFRMGYQWQLENFTTHIELGYWQVKATRESQVSGEIFGDEQNNITGTAELNEFYSEQNFLKRRNSDDWQTNGYGLTIDVSAFWQLSPTLHIDASVKDLFSQFTMKNLGYSKGSIDTNGTFINSLGGQSYLPLYRGIETVKDYQFTLPEQVNLTAYYQHDLANKDKKWSLNYLAHYKRQGDTNFYYVGVQFDFSASELQLMLDLEHLSPEIHYRNTWFDLVLATDKIDLNKAMQFTLGMAINYNF